MKLKIILIHTLFVSLYAIPSYAQFNTIGSPIIKKEVSNKTLGEMRSDSNYTNMRLTLDSNKTHGILENNKFVSNPLKSVHISSGFGMRKHPISHKYILHNGIDLLARYEKVYSMFPGTVVRVGEDDRSGKYLTIRTGGYTISYCHLSLQLVNENDIVNAGTIIAISGNTGASTGPHLHITAKKDGKAFNAAILLEYIKKYNM